MSHEQDASGSPQEWLEYARDDLAMAQGPPPPSGKFSMPCFLAQQAAEKAIKAVYCSRNWPFPFIHDLEKLLIGLERKGVSIPSAIQEASLLSLHASKTRYPGSRVPDEAEFRLALRRAEAVVAWAEAIVMREGS